MLRLTSSSYSFWIPMFVVRIHGMVCCLGSNYYVFCKTIDTWRIQKCYLFLTFVEPACPFNSYYLKIIQCFRLKNWTKELNLFFNKWKPRCDREMKYGEMWCTVVFHLDTDYLLVVKHEDGTHWKPRDSALAKWRVKLSICKPGRLHLL